LSRPRVSNATPRRGSAPWAVAAPGWRACHCGGRRAHWVAAAGSVTAPARATLAGMAACTGLRAQRSCDTLRPVCRPCRSGASPTSRWSWPPPGRRGGCAHLLP